MARSKEKKAAQNYQSIIITLVLVIGSALLMVGSYPTIKKNMIEAGLTYFDQPNFVDEYIIKGAYSLYYESMRASGEEILTPTEIFIKGPTSFHESMNQKRFDEEIFEWQAQLDRSSKNFKYYARNDVSGKVLTNLGEGYLNQSGEVDYKWLENQHQYVIELKVDDRGNVFKPYIYGGGQTSGIGYLDNFNNVATWYVSDPINFEGIQNMTYIFAVPKILPYEDELSFLIDTGNRSGYGLVSESYVIGITCILVSLALFVPMRWIKATRWLNKLKQFSVEVVMIGLLLVLMQIYFSAAEVIYQCMKGEVTYFANFYVKPLALNTTQIVVLNGVFWSIGFGAVLIAVWLIKSMFAEGVWQYIKANSLIVGIYRGIGSVKDKVARKVANKTLKQDSYKKLKKLLIWNSLLMALFCSFWFFGLIGVAIYGIVVYSISKRVYLDLSRKYEKLMSITSGMTSGNLEVHVTENLGLFDPLKGQLSQIQEGFKMAVDEAVKSQKLKTDLITNVSHDLKTPLTSIISYVDLLKDESLSDEKRKQYLETLDRKAARLQLLIEDLFEMSKISSGNIILQKESVDVVALLKQTLFELEDRLVLSQLTVRTHFPEYKVKLELDSMRTYRIFDNLINNMAKYSLAGSRAYIEVQDEEDFVQVILKNIAREELAFDPEQITERFVRGDESRHTEGTGLGLAIAKSFTELQGGHLQVVLDGDLFKIVITFPKI